jgi:hypothetical protein
MGLKLFHEGGRADGRTDMTKLLVAFSQFCEHALKSLKLYNL